MSPSKFPWTTHPHTPTAVFDADGRRIVWDAPVSGLSDIIEVLQSVHSALDGSLGDSDVSHIENDDELREEHPAQWAAQWLAHSIELLSEPTPTPLDPETAAANAVMIAAIPEMLEALEAYEVAIDEAEAIFGGEYADHYGPMFELAMKARDARRAALASIGRTL